MRINVTHRSVKVREEDRPEEMKRFGDLEEGQAFSIERSIFSGRLGGTEENTPFLFVKLDKNSLARTGGRYDVYWLTTGNGCYFGDDDMVYPKTITITVSDW